MRNINVTSFRQSRKKQKLNTLTYLQYIEAGEDVFVLEEPHHLELPEDPLRADEALEHVGQLLEGDPLPVPGVRHRPHHAERTIPDRPVRLELGVGVASYKEKK